jgi:hypothetical protein
MLQNLSGLICTVVVVVVVVVVATAVVLVAVVFAVVAVVLVAVVAVAAVVTVAVVVAAVVVVYSATNQKFLNYFFWNDAAQIVSTLGFLSATIKFNLKCFRKIILPSKCID